MASNGRIERGKKRSSRSDEDLNSGGELGGIDVSKGLEFSFNCGDKNDGDEDLDALEDFEYVLNVTKALNASSKRLSEENKCLERDIKRLKQDLQALMGMHNVLIECLAGSAAGMEGNR